MSLDKIPGLVCLRPWAAKRLAAPFSRDRRGNSRADRRRAEFDPRRGGSLRNVPPSLKPPASASNLSPQKRRPRRIRMRVADYGLSIPVPSRRIAGCKHRHPSALQGATVSEDCPLIFLGICLRQRWHGGCPISLMSTRGYPNGGSSFHCRYSGLFHHLVALCPRLRSSVRVVMGLEYLIGIIVSFLIMGYLIYALLWPEKF